MGINDETLLYLFHFVGIMRKLSDYVLHSFSKSIIIIERQMYKKEGNRVENTVLGFIGAGNMATAIINGIVSTETMRPSQIAVFDVNEENLKQYYEELGTTLGEALLTPTKIYVRPMLSLMKTCTVKAVSHVTGGGFYENLPRMMKEGYTAKIEMNAFPTLPIFDLIQKTGNIPTQDMYSTFNMGIGMCVVVSASEAEKAIAHLKENGEEAFLIGTVVKGEEGVVLC